MEKWNCPAYATNVDNAFANHKILEAAYMFGGYPCEELRQVFEHPGMLGFRDIENFDIPQGLEVIPLPGHSFGMIGIRTSDGVWFIGDSVLNQKALEKYQFGYLVDVEGYLDTLRLLERLEGELFIPSHGDVSEDIRPLAERNRDNIQKNINVILEICRAGKSFDWILKSVFDHYGIAPRMTQYALVGSTLRCYLTWLQDVYKRQVKKGVNAHKRHKKILKQAKGYYGQKSKVFRAANPAVMRALRSAYVGRKNKKREYRKLWIARINAGARMNGISYSRLMDGLKKSGIEINRKMLSEMAIHDAVAFAQLCETAKNAVNK